MDDTVTETKKMAERAYARLNSASDTDFQHVYEYAMKRKKDTNDAVFKSITGKKLFPQVSYPKYILLMQTRLIRLHEGCQRYDPREKPECSKCSHLLR